MVLIVLLSAISSFLGGGNAPKPVNPSGSANQGGAPNPNYGGGVPTGTAKALGGPISPLTPYLVGENGPELFIPQSAGNIIPNAMNDISSLGPISSGRGGGGVQSISLSAPIQVVLNGQVVGQTVQQILLQMGRSQGNLWGGYAGGNQAGTATSINVNAVAR